MRLKDFMDTNRKSIKDLSEGLKCEYENARLYYAGEVIPRPERMKKIYEWSNGAVTPNDFYNITERNKDE